VVPTFTSDASAVELAALNAVTKEAIVKAPSGTVTTTFSGLVPLPIWNVTSVEAPRPACTGVLVLAYEVAKLNVWFEANVVTVSEYDPLIAAFVVVAVTTDSLLDVADLLTPPPDRVVKRLKLVLRVVRLVVNCSKAEFASSRLATFSLLGVTRDFRVASDVASMRAVESIPEASPAKLITGIVWYEFPRLLPYQQDKQTRGHTDGELTPSYQED
jgi:hypothetical protein